MEFDKSRVYTALNADELKAGDKVIVEDNIANLMAKVNNASPIFDEISEIRTIKWIDRFKTQTGDSWHLAYLVERKENCTKCIKNGIDCIPMDGDELSICSDYKPKTEKNCTNCGNRGNSYCSCFTRDKSDDEPSRTVCGNYIRLSEQKAEKKYRPFKDVDELIKVWCGKSPIPHKPMPSLTMPLIWVRNKEYNQECLITGFHPSYQQFVFINKDVGVMMQELFDKWEFLDGSPCGVEE